MLVIPWVDIRYTVLTPLHMVRTVALPTTTQEQARMAFHKLHMELTVRRLVLRPTIPILEQRHEPLPFRHPTASRALAKRITPIQERTAQPIRGRAQPRNGVNPTFRTETNPPPLSTTRLRKGPRRLRRLRRAERPPARVPLTATRPQPRRRTPTCKPGMIETLTETLGDDGRSPMAAV